MAAGSPFDPYTVLDTVANEDATWARELDRGNPERAIEAYVRSLRTGDRRTTVTYDIPELYRRWYDRELGFQGGYSFDPDDVIEKRMTGAYGVEEAFDRRIDWSANPTSDSDDYAYTVEWQEGLNRHFQWIPLADAYDETGDPKYAHAWEEELRNWVLHCPRPNHSGNTVEVESKWRTIATGIRSGWCWPYAFETFRTSDHIRDETLWLFVCGMYEHGRHLLHYPTGWNFKTMEANGLGHVGAMFPELRYARTCLSTAVDRAIAELERQFYPDGIHGELASSYAAVCITNIYSLMKLVEDHLDRFGDPPAGVGYAASGPETIRFPDRSVDRLREIVTAYGSLATPDGTCPPVNDSWSFPVGGMVEECANEGDGLWSTDVSTTFPWGGYAVLRDEGRYALFDAGPYGAAHQHDDTLQLLLFGYNEWLSIDPGQPIYSDSEITEHIQSAGAHNVVLMDGTGRRQHPLVTVTDRPVPLAFAGGETASVTAAKRRFRSVDVGEKAFSHERCVIDVRGVGWLVFDRLAPADDDTHTWEWLWHLPMEVRDEHEGGLSAGYEEGPSLHVTSEGTVSLDAAVVAGQRDPVLRGWRSDPSSTEPAPLETIQFETASVAGPLRLATVILPFPRRTPTTLPTLDTDFADDHWEARLTTDAGPLSIVLHDEAREIRSIECQTVAGSETIDIGAHSG